jgi:hypothetical protein
VKMRLCNRRAVFPRGQQNVSTWPVNVPYGARFQE